MLERAPIEAESKLELFPAISYSQPPTAGGAATTNNVSTGRPKKKKAREKVGRHFFRARLFSVAVRAVFGSARTYPSASTQRPIASIERSAKARLSHPVFLSFPSLSLPLPSSCPSMIICRFLQPLPKRAPPPLSIVCFITSLSHSLVIAAYLYTTRRVPYFFPQGILPRRSVVRSAPSFCDPACMTRAHFLAFNSISKCHATAGASSERPDAGCFCTCQRQAAGY